MANVDDKAVMWRIHGERQRRCAFMGLCISASSLWGDAQAQCIRREQQWLLARESGGSQLLVIVFIFLFDLVGRIIAWSAPKK